jgi:hypothetical protein
MLDRVTNKLQKKALASIKAFISKMSVTLNKRIKQAGISLLDLCKFVFG